MTISAVILTKNEEKSIQSCISSLSWCDEVIVIDDNSSDKTRAIAEKLKAKVYEHSLGNNFAEQRNYGLEKAQGDWILFVDADEQVSQSLAFEIQGKISENIENVQGYFVKRLDSMWGKTLQYGENGKITLLRLARKDAGTWQGKVHETWEISGKTGLLTNPLHHFPHQTVSEFLNEINFYTDVRAQELFDKKTKVSWWHIIVYPKAKFFVNYFIKLGIRDGLPGLMVALLMSFHSFLVRGKLWILWHKK